MLNVLIDHNVPTGYFNIYVRDGYNVLTPDNRWIKVSDGVSYAPYLSLDQHLYESIATAMLGITHADPNYLKDTQQVRDRLLTLVEKLSVGVPLLPAQYGQIQGGQISG